MTPKPQRANTPLPHDQAVQVCVARVAQLDQAIAAAGALTPVGMWLTDVRIPWQAASRWLASRTTTPDAVEAMIIMAARKANINNTPGRQPAFVGFSEVAMFLNQVFTIDQLTAYIDGGQDA